MRRTRLLLRSSLLVVFVIFAPVAVDADDRFTRVLVPIVAETASGAGESRWSVETWFLYTGDEAVEIRPRTHICVITCDWWRETVVPGAPPRRIFSTAPTGLLLYVPKSHAHHFIFHSVAYEASSQSVGSRTTLPTVRECQFRRSAHLLRVPLVRGARTLLRIYGMPEAVNPVVTVRYLTFDADHPTAPTLQLREDTLHLVRSQPAGGWLFLTPSFAAIPHIESFPELLAHDQVWIEVSAASPDLRVWAMASTTDNVTQQVSLVYPQSSCADE